MQKICPDKKDINIKTVFYKLVYYEQVIHGELSNYFNPLRFMGCVNISQICPARKLIFIRYLLLKKQCFPCLILKKFSKNRPLADSFIELRCPSVLSLFMWYILRPILPPLSEVGCPKYLEIRSPWGKVLERSGLTLEHFCLEVV